MFWGGIAMKGNITQEMFRCIPEIDFNIGHRYFVGNMDNYAAALLATLKSIRSKLPILNSMSLSEEYQGLRTITQTLRRISGNIGATNLAEESYQLEAALLNDNTDLVKELLDSYIMSLSELAEHLEILLKNADVSKVARNDEDKSSFLNYDFSRTKESIKRSSGYLDRKII